MMKFIYCIIFCLTSSVSAQLKVKYTYAYGDYGNAEKRKEVLDTVLQHPMDYWQLSRIFWLGFPTPKYYLYSDSAAQHEVDWYREYASHKRSYQPFENGYRGYTDTTLKHITILRDETGYAYPFHAPEEFTFDSLNRIIHYYCSNDSPEGMNADEDYYYTYDKNGLLTYILNAATKQQDVIIMYDEKGRVSKVVSFITGQYDVQKFVLKVEYE